MPRHTITAGGGVRLARHEYGQPHGKPILLLHGFGQFHLAWAKQYQSPLADEFRLGCLDNRGHGMFEKPIALEQYAQPERWADDVRAVITSRALCRPILVGWSYGGFIINDYLVQYGQDAVGGINYVCAGVLLGAEKAATTFGSAFLDAVPGLWSENLEDNIRALRPFLHAVFAKQPSHDEFEVMVAFNMVVPPAVRLGMVSRSIDRDAVLRSLTVPVLVTAGDQDQVVLAAHTQHLRSCIPQAQSSVYAAIGHAPPLEAPERFNRELAVFARQHAG